MHLLLTNMLHWTQKLPRLLLKLMHLTHLLNHNCMWVPLPSLYHDRSPTTINNHLLRGQLRLFIHELWTRLRFLLRATSNRFVHTWLLIIHQSLNRAPAPDYFLLLSIHRCIEAQSLANSLNAIVTVVFAHTRKIIQVNLNDSRPKILNNRHHGNPTNVLFLLSKWFTFLVWDFWHVGVVALVFNCKSLFLLDHVLTFTTNVGLRDNLI